MAKTAKKDNALTPEEKLESMLVPDIEQPYKIPKNWCWLNLLDSFSNRTDSKRKIQQKEYLPEGMFAIVDQGQELIGGYTNDKEMLFNGQLPIIVFGDHTRCIKYIDFPFAQGADGVKVLSPKKFYLSKAFYYALHSVAIPNLGYRRHYPLFKNYYIPLPPLAEQQRIVDRIESLFAKLDEAKEKAQAVVDGFEDRKAAILHKAFTGKLTAEWRKENGYGIESWEDTILSKVLDVRDGTHDSPQYYDEGFPLVTSKNLKNGKITDKDLKLISKEDYEKINERSKVDVGDILFAMIGTIGNPVVVEEEPFYAIKNIALFKNIGKIDPYYVKYYLESKTVMEKMKRDAKGSTQRFVALGYLRSFPIMVPTKYEQKIIVKRADRLLGAEIQAKEAAEKIIDRIDTMKKAVLASAFRGELGTNDPKDESAMELLKRILK